MTAWLNAAFKVACRRGAGICFWFKLNGMLLAFLKMISLGEYLLSDLEGGYVRRMRNAENGNF